MSEGALLIIMGVCFFSGVLCALIFLEAERYDSPRRK